MAAASATATASAAAASAAAVSAAAAVPAAAAAGKFLYARLQVCGVFLVEDKERRQTDVGELFLTERDFVRRCGLLQRQIRGRRAGRRGCATSHRQQPSSSQNRNRFRPCFRFGACFACDMVSPPISSNKMFELMINQPTPTPL